MFFSCLGTTIKTAVAKRISQELITPPLSTLRKPRRRMMQIIHARFRNGRERGLDVLLQSDQGPD
jgi:hypothetical protein